MQPNKLLKSFCHPHFLLHSEVLMDDTEFPFVHCFTQSCMAVWLTPAQRTHPAQHPSLRLHFNLEPLQPHPQDSRSYVLLALKQGKFVRAAWLALRTHLDLIGSGFHSPVGHHCLHCKPNLRQ